MFLVCSSVYTRTYLPTYRTYVIPSVVLIMCECIRYVRLWPSSLQDENGSTPKTMSMLRKKLGKVMSKSAGRKGELF